MTNPNIKLQIEKRKYRVGHIAQVHYLTSAVIRISVVSLNSNWTEKCFGKHS